MKSEERKALISLMTRHRKVYAGSKQAATDLLIKEGIYTQDMQLSPDYGGPLKKTGHSAKGR